MNDLVTEEKIEALITNEYEFYNSTVKLFISMVEVAYEAIPDGMLNDIRCFMGHISDAKIRVSDKLTFREENIKAAHNHLRRILLDCYKLLIIDMQKYIKQFNKQFRWFNLNDVNNGNFCVDFAKLINEAEKAFIEAKNQERTGKNDRDKEDLGKVYSCYEDAFNKFCEVRKFIDNSYDAVVRIARKQCVGKILGFLGWTIGIAVSIIFAVVKF